MRSFRHSATLIGLILLAGTAVHPVFRPYVVLCVLNGVVLANAVLLYTHLHRSGTWTDAILGVAVIALSQITVTELYLGLAGHLSLVTVSAAQAGCLGLTGIAIRMGWLVAPSWTACRRAVTGFLQTGLDLITSSRATILAGAVTCCVFAFVFGISSLNPPISIDSLFFHFMRPVEWLQSGRIPIQLMDRYAYPHGTGLIMAWFLLPFHHDFVARFCQIPFILMGCVASYGICRSLGVDRRLAFITATAVLTIPAYLANGIALTDPDTQMAGTALVALHFGLSLARAYRFSTVVLLSLSLGLLLSSKYNSVYYGVPLVLLVVYAWNKGRSRPESRQGRRATALLHAFLLMSVPLGIGGITHLDDLITRHRVYPFSTVSSLDELFNPYRPVFHVSLFMLSPQSLKSVGLSVLIGLSVVYGLVQLLRTRRWREVVLPMFVVFPVVFSLLIYTRFGYYAGPMAIRHLLATIALCVILAGWTVAQMGERGRWYGTWGLVGVTIISSFLGFTRQWPVHRMPTRILSAVLAVAGGIVVWRLLTAARAGRTVPPRLAAVASSPPVLIFTAWLVLLGLHGWERAYRAHKYDTWPTWYGYGVSWEWIARATVSQGARIACNVGPYPLFGYDLQNEVIWLSARLTRDDPPAQRAQRLMEWEQDLIRQRIDYLYLFALGRKGVQPINQHERFDIESAWAESRPETFTCVYYAGRERIYRVKRPPPLTRTR
ncbi:MAG: glycosyltransferase family 39 protein [Candidatus Latescibacteria bacterium]|nr:glycosyltransferase family 39 protein [Candidatus Latescibacterota bacterium]